MGKKSYVSGRRFEYRVRDALVALGYLVVRTPGSKSPFDLVVMGRHQWFLVQCKVDGRLGPVGWNALLNVAESVRCLPIVVFREKRRLQWRSIVGPKTRLRQPQPWVKIDVLANPAHA